MKEIILHTSFSLFDIIKNGGLKFEIDVTNISLINWVWSIDYFVKWDFQYRTWYIFKNNLFEHPTLLKMIITLWDPNHNKVLLAKTILLKIIFLSNQILSKLN